MTHDKFLFVEIFQLQTHPEMARVGLYKVVASLGEFFFIGISFVVENLRE